MEILCRMYILEYCFSWIIVFIFFFLELRCYKSSVCKSLFILRRLKKVYINGQLSIYCNIINIHTINFLSFLSKLFIKKLRILYQCINHFLLIDFSFLFPCSTVNKPTKASWICQHPFEEKYKRKPRNRFIKVSKIHIHTQQQQKNESIKHMMRKHKSKCVFSCILLI